VSDWIQTALEQALDHWHQLIKWLTAEGLPDPPKLAITIVGFIITSILGAIRWLAPKLWRRICRISQHPVDPKALYEKLPFEVIKPPKQIGEAKEQEILKQLLESQEPLDYPLADFNIPYQRRDLKIDILQSLEQCVQEKNWVLILGRSGLGKTREAAQLALRLREQGWTILKPTMDLKWLEVPHQFPQVPSRKLLFFLDDLNLLGYIPRRSAAKS
jgi:hypothetical protein